MSLFAEPAGSWDAGFRYFHDRPVCGGHPGRAQSVDTGKVWIQTDDVSTCIRGRAEHVFDVTRAIFAYAAASGVHTVLMALIPSAPRRYGRRCIYD